MAKLIVRANDRTGSENQNDTKFGHKMQECYCSEWYLHCVGFPFQCVAVHVSTVPSVSRGCDPNFLMLSLNYHIAGILIYIPLGHMTTYTDLSKKKSIPFTS